MGKANSRRTERTFIDLNDISARKFEKFGKTK